MPLHIDDEKTERLARELAEATGESLAEAVIKALEERLAHQRKLRTAKEREARIERILAEFDALPVLDDRSPEEMLYDEYGLPK